MHAALYRGLPLWALAYRTRQLVLPQQQAQLLQQVQP